MALDRVVETPRVGLLSGKRRTLILADRARDAGHWELAAQLYRKALNRNPRNPPLWVQYGHALKESGELHDPDKLAQAEIAYRRALSLDPAVADSYLQLGHVLKLQGKTDQAESAYLRAFVLDPSMRYPLDELGRLGWSESALSDLRMQIEPAGPDTLCQEPSDRSVAVHQRFDVVETVLAEASRKADELLTAVRAVPQSGSPETSLSVALRRADKTYSPRPAPTTRRQVQIPDLFEIRGAKPYGRIAVVLHLFDPDLWNEMREAIECICHPFDLFVSLTKGASDHMRGSIKESFPQARIFDFDNHGRDIAPFLVFLQSGVLFRYDLVCKLHTKRSPHLPDGDAWRRGLIEGVLGGSRLIDEIIAAFRADPNLGMVVADGNIYSGHEHWAGTEKLLAELLPRIGISTDLRNRSFPGGSIFWIRSFLLRTLAGARIDFQDFDPEPLIQDGGLGHAVERMFGLICEDAGMRVLEHSRLAKAVEQPSSSSRVHIVALYLPQFHPIRENDEWWGAGFTEWTNVTSARALFADHRQPRLPSELGFYDLRLAEVREKQAELARAYGLAAFCYYYYWFNGRRVLERPLDEVSGSGKPDFPFLIIWANEPWSRNWDGLSQDVLLPQTYEHGWTTRFASEVAPLLHDRRYFRLDGKPMLLIYRIGHIPEAAAAMLELRNRLSEEGIPEVHLAAAWVTFPDDAELPADPSALGLDAYFEFPPHRTLRQPPHPLPSGIPEELGGLYDYNYTVTAALSHLNDLHEGRRHRGVMLGWDNTPRRGEHAFVFHGATPANFRRWLHGTVVHERQQGGERVVFVNAWNEWAEGTYLEPDRKFGRGWLEAVASAVDPGLSTSLAGGGQLKPRRSEFGDETAVQSPVAPPPRARSRGDSTSPVAMEKTELDIKTIRGSGLFEEAYYRASNPNLPAGIDAVRHFVEWGMRAGRMPNRMFDPEFYLRLNPDVAQRGDNPLVHFIHDGANEGRRPHRSFDPAFYLAMYPDVARAGVNPLWHYLSNGEGEGRKAAAAVTDTEIQCLKQPSFRGEVALFATHSSHGRLQPHVRHYLDSLKRQNISVILVVATNTLFTDADTNLVNRMDGIFLRRAEGFDFAAWAHILLLHPSLLDAKILYLINDSMIGPTDDATFGELLTRVRNSSADVVGLTESLQQGWHFQSYFLALKARALSSAAFQNFINEIVPYGDKDHVIKEFEIQFALILKAAGLNCEAMFRARDSGNPTLHHWRHLLQSGFPFLKVQVIRDVIVGVDVSDWRELLAARGYDISLAERTLAEANAPSLATQRFASFSWISDRGPSAAEAQDRNLLFDEAWYLGQYAEASASGLNPLDHYRRLGVARGYDPHPLFDTSYYLERYPDVAASGVNPLEHFIEVGAAEGRHPHPLFDTVYYLCVEQACDEANVRMNPLEHFIRFGATEGWNPNPMFNTRYYLHHNPDVAEAGINPLVHFLLAGAAEGRDPHPLFDTSYYCEQYPDVAEAGVNPLEHFLQVGAAEIRRPHPLFYTFYYVYLERMVEVWTTPLEYLLRSRTAEGRRPHPLFDTSYYLKHNPDVAEAGIDPFEHFVVAGGAEGRNPHPLFDTSYYLTRFPEAANAGVDPLEHFLRVGDAAGRSPHPVFDMLRLVDRYCVARGQRQRAPGRRRIQVHRARALGDVILMTPVLKALRREHPKDEIIVSTIYPELLLGNPYIDAVLKSPIPLPGFDETHILEYEMRPDEHIVDAYAHIARVSVPDVTPEIYLRHDERIAASKLLADAGIHWYERFCAMAMTGNDALDVRSWPIARFKAVAEELEREGVRVVVLGQRPEPPIDFGVDLRGKTALRMAAAIIEKCALMVTIDSGLMHLGYAARRPVISLFGSTDPEKRIPNWALPSTLYSDIVCHGCHHRQRPVPAIQGPNCPWETILCMDRLAPDMVMRQVRVELERAEKPAVSIVIPHYISYRFLESCLSSIYRHGARCSFEVIVVADGSPVEILEQLQAWRPNLQIVTLQPNQGFSKACNAGARVARGRYVVFLNDDTTVTPGWLDEMLRLAEAEPQIGIIGPKLLYPGSDCIQHCGTVFNEQNLGEHIYRVLPGDFVGANRPRYFRALTGACLLLEREFFLTLGQFDTSYHGRGGCEDTDLCFKVLEQGRMVAYCPASVVHHHEGVTRGRRDEHHPEEKYNRDILRQRWSKYLAPDISDYYLLAEIEAGEGKTWRWLQDVSPETVARYDSPERRAVGRPPFRIQIGSGEHPEAGYLHLDAAPDAPSVDIIHDIVEPLPFLDGSVGEILTSDIVGRLSPQGLLQVIGDFHRVLSKDGRLVIRTGNVRRIAEDYLHRRKSSIFSGANAPDLSPSAGYTPVEEAEAEPVADGGRCAEFRDESAEGETLVGLCRVAGFSEAHYVPVVDQQSSGESLVVAVH